MDKILSEYEALMSKVKDKDELTIGLAHLYYQNYHFVKA